MLLLLGSLRGPISVVGATIFPMLIAAWCGLRSHGQPYHFSQALRVISTQ